jgi:hypothetical protein
MARSTALLALVAWLGALAAPAEANPAIGWNALGLVTSTKAVALKTGGIKTVTATCPKGLVALTGGAFFFEEGHGPLPTQASVTRLLASYSSAKGWTARGYNLGGPDDLELEAVAQCGGFENQTVKASLTVSPGVSFSTTVGCPTQDGFTENAYGGGGFLSGPASALKAGSGITSTVMENIPWRWTVGAADFGQSPLTLTLVVVCAGFRLDFANFQTLSQDGIVAGTAGGYLACPPGSHAMSGSAVFLDGSANIMTSNVMLSSSSMTVDSTGWYFAASNPSSIPANFRGFLFCLNDT